MQRRKHTTLGWWSLTLLSMCLPVCVPHTPTLPNVTVSGYVDIDNPADNSHGRGAKLFYALYEVAQPLDNSHDVPVLLWLQGGPGCASMFGNLYELGPQRVHDTDSGPDLEDNPWAWNRRHMALLFIDQPIGTGFSLQGHRDIPTDEATVAADLYVALQQLWKLDVFKGRSLLIAGESYAAHYILSMEREATSAPPMPNARPLPPRMLAAGRPHFSLVGVAIGNGLTAPDIQVMSHADVAYALGLVSAEQRIKLLKAQLDVQQHVYAGQWYEAWQARTDLLEALVKYSGAATLLDVRRDEDYDASQSVQRYLQQADVKAALGVSEDVDFASCSVKVAEALGPDVMKSVLHLLPDVVNTVPTLLYQGQYDLQDGPASCNDWIHTLQWSHQQDFNRAPRKGKTPVVAWWQEYGHLTSVVVRDAGHMVPHDQGQVVVSMVEQWASKAMRKAQDWRKT